MSQLITPDQRYIVVRGRLWRAANPHLSPEVRAQFASQANDEDRLAAARAAVSKAKVAPGEHGPVCWNDGARDLNRHLVKHRPYADWYASIDQL